MAEITVERRERIARTTTHDVALDCLAAGVAAALPERIVEERLSVDDGTVRVTAVDGGETEHDLGAYDTVRLVGAGKAAGGAGRAVADALGDRLDGGTVVTTDPDGGDGAARTDASRPFETLPGDHPLPSDRRVASTRRVIEVAESASTDDLVVAVITGGGSALLAAPADPLSVENLRTLTDELLASGASIDEINAVRKHCSAVKGGRLARIAAPATVVTLAVSDVVGDDLGVIASGPTAPDPSTYADALGVCERYDLDLPTAVREHLRAGVAGDRPETPTASEPAFDRTRTLVVGNGRTALDAAASAAADRGYDPTVLAAGVRGEAREAALTHVAIAEECGESGSPASPPCVLLSGGETTVTLGDDPGRGGPNTEFAASAGVALAEGDADPSARVVVASVDTDGVDGASGAAGGIVDATTFDGATTPNGSATLDTDAARDALDRHDIAPLLDEADALLRTGSTGTNVNDLRVLVVDGERAERE
ncbi:hydroxypyruvate reductase [Halorubrum alkaliphilum]|uniref:Hydroxypyruvate reductase n=1 Tax=Halorubrum alkaliphilum TaxID=261290 RepID=A0A8T4GI27_9EURY|nr:DUF4147 domain-containing protein [Halorubrum alkaliphilum]MBP1923389.1 hydroxypyruvate reductase [Halorubrum alkaliphilum]